MNIPNYAVYPQSEIEKDGIYYALVRNPLSGTKKLVVKGKSQGFLACEKVAGDTVLCDLSAENAVELRRRLAYLNPQPIGLKKSFGFGDRLGLATPGHIASLTGSCVVPVFAQQSVRENARTKRQPQQVVDDAMWGALQAGWTGLWGADADHIKTPDVLDSFVAAGYTMFTIDPGDHVDQKADGYALETLRNMSASIPGEWLKQNSADVLKAWDGKRVDGLALSFSEETVLRALIKYGKAIWHTVNMYEEIRKRIGSHNFDFEVSVDETDTPTSIAEHYFIASELTRLGVQWTSLAPRFIGKFEKGVDFIGDLAEFDAQMALHARIPQFFGEYKISLHSGSDKFSVYPSVNRHTQGKLHVKTAGTSYLEALKVIADYEPEFFAEVLAFVMSRYDTDKASYHVSAELVKVSQDKNVLRDLLNQFDARQVFHVTYGSVLERYSKRIMDILKREETAFAGKLESHFRHHLDLLK